MHSEQKRKSPAGLITQGHPYSEEGTGFFVEQTHCEQRMTEGDSPFPIRYRPALFGIHGSYIVIRGMDVRLTVI